MLFLVDEKVEKGNRCQLKIFHFNFLEMDTKMDCIVNQFSLETVLIVTIILRNPPNRRTLSTNSPWKLFLSLLLSL